jgi:site-specific DNA-methyltransferase (adenine-specific)
MWSRTFHRSIRKPKKDLVTRRRNLSRCLSESLAPQQIPATSFSIRFADAAQPFTPRRNSGASGSASIVTYLAINLIKRRLQDAFGEEIEFQEKGQPTDFESAKCLAKLDKFQFQHWALSLIGARPLKEGEGKGADRGVDGLLYYYETERKDLLNRIKEDAPAVRNDPVHREKIIVQVKGGGVNRGDVATLLGDVENQKAAGGVLITLEKPSRQMRTEAADGGRFASKLWHDKDYPKIQILTVEGLLNGSERVDAPPQINPFATAARETAAHKQTEML